MTVNPKSLENLQPLQPGVDKRRNLKGRPRSFDALRKLAQAIAAEPLSDSEKLTRIEALLRLMSSSRNPADRKTFLEYAFGKPKDEIEHSGELKVIRFVDETKKPDADS